MGLTNHVQTPALIRAEKFEKGKACMEKGSKNVLEVLQEDQESDN